VSESFQGLRLMRADFYRGIDPEQFMVTQAEPAGPSIQFDDSDLFVDFTQRDFGIQNYPLFLKLKGIPETRVEFDRSTESYRIRAPRRFAGMLGVVPPVVSRPELPLLQVLLDDQVAITRMALEAKRFAVWSDCGLGKTLIALEFARQVVHQRGGRAVIVTLNDLVDSFRDECQRFYGNTLPLVRLRTRLEMRCWCLDGTCGRPLTRADELEKRPESARNAIHDRSLAASRVYRERLAAGKLELDWSRWGEFTLELSSGERVEVCWNPVATITGSGHFEFYGSAISETGYRSQFMHADPDLSVTEFARQFAEDLAWEQAGKRGRAPEPPTVGITNYEKFNPEDGPRKQIVSELRCLSAFILDEASRLRSGGGAQKWAIIKSSRGIEFKLACTATPAPNDTMEFASQASFLERMRSEGEIIWTYFHKDRKTHRWRVRKNAREAFFRFMASWSIYVRDPRKYGWRLNHEPVPEPIVKIVPIDSTPQQQVAMRRLNRDANGQGRLFGEDTNAIQRVRLSEVAKGFLYGPKPERAVERIPSLKPGVVADLAAEQVAEGRSTLIWTQFEAETDILVEQLKARGLDPLVISGKVPRKDRYGIMARFKSGEKPLLIGRARMIGYGQNLQMCRSMIFSGWNDSFEEWYQAIRRAVRHGQTDQVRVFVPVIEDLEGDMLENVLDKEAKHLSAIDEMERNYIAANHQMALVRKAQQERALNV